jgi:hypothetical protein
MTTDVTALQGLESLQWGETEFVPICHNVSCMLTWSL